VMGEDYTICDPYLFTICSWLEGDGVDTSRLPGILAHRDRILERPATQAALSRLQ
jgi:glutathione S-transferase